MFTRKNYLVTIIFICLLSLFVLCQEQPVNNDARKTAESGYLNCETLIARLDSISIELYSNPLAQLYIIGYSEPNSPLDKVPHLLRSAKYHLNKMRGIEDNRVVILNGGYQKHEKIEYWLVPAGANPPQPSSKNEVKKDSKAAQKFDEGFASAYKLEKGCTLVFCDACICLAEGLDLEEYAKQIKSDSNQRAHIFLYFGTSGLETECKAFRTRAALLKNELIQKLGVNARQLTIAYGGRRKISEMELWLIPKGASLPKPTPTNFRNKDKFRRK